MKITFVIQDLFQQGAEYVTALMIRGFVEKGYDVELLVSQIHSYLLEMGEKPFVIPSSVPVITMPAPEARYNVLFLREYIKKSRDGVIIAMGPTYLFALGLAAFGIKRHVKLAYVEHGGLSSEQRSIDDVVKPSFPSIKWILAKVIKSSIDVFMGVSTGSSRILEKMLTLDAGSAVTVYNPVIDEAFKDKLRSETMEPWLRNKDIKTVCAAGAFCELKGHLTLFKAMQIVNKVEPVRLVLFGKGELEETYKEWIESHNMSDRIKLAGHTHNLPAEIKSADALICSSVVESFSIVLIEALASGIPVISTSCNYGPPEILENGQYGLLVPVGDENALARAILETCSGKAKKVVSEEAWKRFELSRIVSNYEKALRI